MTQATRRGRIDAYAAEYDEAPLEVEIVAPDEAVEDAAEPYDEASEESSPEDVWAEDNTATLTQPMPTQRRPGPACF